MKIYINTYKNKLRYRIYDVSGFKRKLNKSGKLNKCKEINFQPISDEIVIRITKNYVYLLPFVWLIFTIVELLDSFSQYTWVNFFYEIRIYNVNSVDTIKIEYRDVRPDIANGFKDNVQEKYIYSNVLTCSNLPYKRETKKNTQINKFMLVLTIIFFVLVLVSIPLILYAKTTDFA